MLVTLGYNDHWVLPYKDGAALMLALNSAEKYSDEYRKPKRIVEFDRNSVTCQIMPYQEYQRIKIAALLNILPEELEEFANKEADESA